MRSPLLAAGVVMGVSLGVPPGLGAAGHAGAPGSGRAVEDSGGGWSSGRRASLELRGPWMFRQAASGKKPPPAPGAAADGDGWLPATVPGCVHTDLLANHKIADPFYATNEKDQQWIDKLDWEYLTTFSVDEGLLSRERIELDFRGLDTYAEVFVNGASVLTADNMFRSWRVAVKPHLKKGENTLLVRFRSPISHVKAAYDRLGYVLPAANDQATPMVSMFTRKAPYHYGWDWGPRFVTSGIWRPVRLEAWDDARIDDVQVVQTGLTDARATLQVRTTVVASHGGRAQIALALAGGVPLGEVTAALKTGRNVVEVEVAIDRPQRWWPNGLGPAHLYTVDASLAVDGVARDARAVRIGLRNLQVIHWPDKDGKSFTIEVNGAPVFMKGANYIPSDSFLNRVTPDRYRWLVRSAADAHMNMLRVWGGGIYEDDRFYELCDELGILVWQDFMFACSMYPGDAPFIENVRQEAIENVRRLRNHPSLALWAGNNEIEAAWKGWGWQDKFHLNKAAQDKIWRAYTKVFHEVLPKVVAEHDPQRFYTRSSPSANDDNVPANKLGFGDMHYWGVWHAEAPYTDYGPNTSRFMSEYGFQSFPELASVARYATPADHDIESPVMLAHQRHPRGNLLVRTYMDRDFRKPKDFGSFLYVSQVLQARVIQYAAEAHRRRMPYNQGSLYWQLDDCWPVASWAGMDYFGRWKALHYAARRFFAAILLSTVEEGSEIRVYGVSDLRTDTPGHLVARLLDFEGRELWRKESDVKLGANSSAVLLSMARAEVLRANADPARVVLAIDLAGVSGVGRGRLARSLFYFVKTKDLALPDPELSVLVTPDATGQSMGVRVSARRLARDVYLVTDPAPTEREQMFSDNYFDLLPGESINLEWKGPAQKVIARTIRDSY
jgi:beta-mannosidase